MKTEVMVVRGRPKPQRGGAGILGRRYKASSSAGSALSLFVGEGYDKGRQDWSLLPMGDRLHLAVGNDAERTLLNGLIVVLS